MPRQNKDYRVVGATLKRLREEKQLSLEEISERINQDLELPTKYAVPPSHVAKVESGFIIPHPDYVAALERVLSVSSGDICSLYGQQPPLVRSVRLMNPEVDDPASYEPGQRLCFDLTDHTIDEVASWSQKAHAIIPPEAEHDAAAFVRASPHIIALPPYGRVLSDREKGELRRAGILIVNPPESYRSAMKQKDSQAAKKALENHFNQLHRVYFKEHIAQHITQEIPANMEYQSVFEYAPTLSAEQKKRLLDIINRRDNTFRLE